MVKARVVVALLCFHLASGVKLGFDDQDQQKPDWMIKAAEQHKKNATVRIAWAREEAAAFKHNEELQRQHFEDEMRPEIERVKATQAMAEAAEKAEEESHASHHRESTVEMHHKRERLLDAVIDGQEAARREEERRVERLRAEREAKAREADLHVANRMSSLDIEAAKAAAAAKEAAELRALEDAKKKKHDDFTRLEKETKTSQTIQKKDESQNEYLAAMNADAQKMQAEAARVNANQDPHDVKFGNHSLADVLDVLALFSADLVNNSMLVSEIMQGTTELKASAGRFVKSSAGALAWLVQQTQNATIEEAKDKLLDFFRGSEEISMTHYQDINTTSAKVKEAISADVLRRLKPFLDTVPTREPIHIEDSDSNASLAEVCPKFQKIMASAATTYEDATFAQAFLNQTAPLIFQLHETMPEVYTLEFSATMKDFLSYTYVETLAWRYITKKYSEDIAPTVDRFNCDSLIQENQGSQFQSAAPSRSGQGFLAAVIASAFVWLTL